MSTWESGSRDEMEGAHFHGVHEISLGRGRLVEAKPEEYDTHLCWTISPATKLVAEFRIGYIVIDRKQTNGNGQRCLVLSGNGTFGFMARGSGRYVLDE